MSEAARLLAFCCLLVLVQACLANGDDIRTGVPRPAVYRRLMQNVSPSEAEDIKGSIADADGEPGGVTDWVVACQPGRQRCPNLFLASWGYQCTTMDGSACCLLPNGKFCTSLSRWEGHEEPQSWQGRDKTGEASEAASSKGEGGEGEDNCESEGPASYDEAQELRRSKERKDAGAEEEGGSESNGGDNSEEGGSGRWQKATATYFNSYPACCYDDDADQTECRDYNGCEWAGQFKGADDKKSHSWVEDNNIVSLFEAGKQKDWERRWKGKTVLLKNPYNGETLEAQVLDTCSDSDCGGCCSANARRNGGFLIDMEYHTATRFWGGGVVDESAIEWQEI